MNSVRNEYTITWIIENYSYCWHKNGENLVSPEFTADGLDGTVWTLDLFPRGESAEDKGYIPVYLNRKTVDAGPEVISLNYQISVLRKDGSCLQSPVYKSGLFKKGEGEGPTKFLLFYDVHLHRKNEYLPQNILTLQCKIWLGEGNIQQVYQITARTRLGIKKVTFYHASENILELEPYVKKTINIKLPSNEKHVLSSSLYFSDDLCCELKIMVELIPSSRELILSKCAVFLLDSSAVLLKCGKADARPSETRKAILKVPLSVSRKDILNKKLKYLSDDKLCLLYKCTFSTGDVDYEIIEQTVHNMPIVALHQISNNNNKVLYKKKLSECHSALDDLVDMFNNQLLTDVVLKTKTKAFPAHKNLLCARSPVFKAMLTSDMKEKNNDTVHIDELEDDVLEQLLLFLYSDKVETLQWELAKKLYYVGDKYTIEKLKLLCSCYLLENLSETNASELLLLADMHSDSDLKNSVEDFISKHEKQVYNSCEWGTFIETNPKLASKTMLLMFQRKMLVA